MPSDKTLEVKPGSLDSTSMRYHELWLQRWFYSRFFVRQGYPIPLVFSTPMDAYSLFTKLWSDAQNPFAYLLEAKDEKGTPLYEPHPSPMRYPLISVMRKGLKFRPYQNFSIHRWRHINWPTVSDSEQVPGTQQIGTNLTRVDLAHVTTSRMPMAYDYRFQVDHFCLRPDTQAFYLEKLMNQFWRSGGVLQTWMAIEYPGWGQKYVRLYIDGDIDQSVQEEYQDKNVEFRTSFTVALEGFSVDVRYSIKPALWNLVVCTATPDQLDRLLQVEAEVDLRLKGHNPVLESRRNIPAAGTIAQDMAIQDWVNYGTTAIELGDQQGTVSGINVIDGNRQPVLAPSDALFAKPTFSYGIPSTLIFGDGTIMPA